MCATITLQWLDTVDTLAPPLDTLDTPAATVLRAADRLKRKQVSFSLSAGPRPVVWEVCNEIARLVMQ